MKSTAEVVKVKDCFAWIETRGEPAISIRASTREGKPIDLTSEETRLLANRLIKLADMLDSLVEQKRLREGEG